MSTWKMLGDQPPEQLATHSLSSLGTLFSSKIDQWAPRGIFDAKTKPALQPLQLDFVDAGLMAILEGMVQEKLTGLLGSLVELVVSLQSEFMVPKMSEEELFRFIFRFIAAKVLLDRGNAPTLGSLPALEVLDWVERYYGIGQKEANGSARPPEVAAQTWGRLLNTFSFNNLSVDDLAFIYETAFITPEVRKHLGTHSTPPTVAEYIVDRLPFDSLHLHERRVFEPCSGHGVFLIAAMRRIRELLPLTLTNEERHEYLKERLVGLEIDTFAREVCRLSLMLADYPNPNGWRLLSDDVFSTRTLEDELKLADIVLCNPPHARFSVEEKGALGDRISKFSKPAEVLYRVLQNPPKALAFVLPKALLNGREYREARAIIAKTYAEIELIHLPDNVFSFADQETALLLAWSRSDLHDHTLVRSLFVSNQSYESIGIAGNYIQAQHDLANLGRDAKLYLPPLTHVWDFLANCPSVSDFATVQRGLEWNPGTRKEDVVSLIVRRDWERGYVSALGLCPYRVSAHYVNPESENIERMPAAMKSGKPKIVVNANRASRGLWRLFADEDLDGLLATQSFHCVWPKENDSWDLVLAVLNSGIANAFMFTQDDRHNRVSYIKSIPIPVAENAVRRFISARLSALPTYVESADFTSAGSAVAEVEAALLYAFGLPPTLKDELLNLVDTYPVPHIWPVAGYRSAVLEAETVLQFELNYLKRVDEYQNLVEKSFQFQLKPHEIAMLGALGIEIDSYNSRYYEPIIKRLTS